MAQFQIKRGYRKYLFDENNNPSIPLEEGCWYLTLDTAEVFVAINNELKPLNQAEINLDDYDDRFESIEARLDAIEANAGKREITFAEFSQFPTIGESNVLYIALDRNASYVFINGSYICVGEDSHYTIINGGNAN